MAESMASLLECPICLNSYTDPRMLACLHTLCYKCLDDLIKHSGQDKQFQCPVDRKSLQIPEDGADAFPKNFFVNSYMAVVPDTGTGARSKKKPQTGEGQQGKETRCSNSVDGDECLKAERFCQECCEYYCKTCSKVHQRSKLSRNHAQVALDDLTDKILRDATSKSETPRCLTHKDELKLYCSTCQCAVCAVCCHVVHQSHTFREISDVDKDLKSELDELMATLQRLMEEVKQQTTQINQSKQRLDNSTSNARATTKDIFQKVQKMLDQKAKEIDQTICDINTDGGGKVDIQNKNLTLHAQLLESMHIFVNDLLKRGTVYNRLVSLPELRSRLQDFQTPPLQYSSTEICGEFPENIPLEFPSGEFSMKNLWGIPHGEFPVNSPWGILRKFQGPTDGATPGVTLSSDDLVVKHLDGLVLEHEVKLSGAGSNNGQTLMIKIDCRIKQEVFIAVPS